MKGNRNNFVPRWTPPLKPLCQIQWKSEPLRKLAAQIQPKDVDVMSAWNMNLEGCPFSVVEMVGRLPYIMVSVAMIPGKKKHDKTKFGNQKITAPLCDSSPYSTHHLENTNCAQKPRHVPFCGFIGTSVPAHVSKPPTRPTK